MNRINQLLIICLLLMQGLFAMGQGFKNPVIPGFYPDPSVCRVGDDYYLVNSTFQFFPGVPIHHSKDLVNWKQIGYVLNRPSQLKLDNAHYGAGIWAPTIRYHEGIFYMITTNLNDRLNFVVSTNDPTGEWSDPVWLDVPSSIDPDLFWDDDGKCYVTTSRGGKYGNNIWCTEVDLKTGKQLAKPRMLWNGTGGRCAEAPHIYKKDNYYYLLLAEGGTEYGHRVTIARSHSLFGPYESNPANPVLTHMNLGGQSRGIQGTGHADLIQAHDGSWWVVFLGFRPQEGRFHLTGRETYLSPVRWDKNAWPVVNGNGVVTENMDCETLPQVKVPALPNRDDFNEPAHRIEWNTLCRPHTEKITLNKRKGHLRLYADTITMNEYDSPIFMGRRQQHIKFRATTVLDFSNLKDGAEAGISMYMSKDARYDLAVVSRNGESYLQLTYHLSQMHHLEKEIKLKGKQVYLRVESDKKNYRFYYSSNNKDYEFMGSMHVKYISKEVAGGYTGIYIGMFAQTKNDNGSYADIDWFEYNGL